MSITERNTDMNIFAEAHRGYRSEYPENTLISFQKAMELPIDAFEFDVWLSADGVPVIMHDGNTKRTTGVDAMLNQLTLAQIKELDAGSHKDARFAGEQVPTLEELLALARRMRPELRLGVEIKDYREETVDKTVALLKEYGFFDGCWFYAFNARIIKYIKTVYGGRTMGYPDFKMKEFEQDSYDYYDEIGLEMSLVKSEILPFYAQKGLPMHFYCADTEEDVRLCIQNGASLITANDPIPLLKVLGKID
jgi:glycerophosphoryl diester phosphodiesterase